MMWKRKKYSLRNCNPPERTKRKKVNKLNFTTKFPFCSFDDTRIDMMLLRRFLYRNEIPCEYLYTKEQLRKALKKDKTVEPVDMWPKAVNRFELMDMES
jgi:hypothetical protein